MEVRERILQASDELFRQYGIRSITMDDIACHLSISKKTIYRYFPDKKHIVNEEIKTALVKVAADLDIIRSEASDAVDEILDILDYMKEMFANLSPAVFYDLQKYYPATWKMFREFQQDYLRWSLVDNLERGIREGYYREELDIEITAQLRMNQFLCTYDPNLFPTPKFNLRDVQMQSITLFLYGIVTLKGFRLIKNYQSIKTRLSKRQKSIK